MNDKKPVRVRDVMASDFQTVDGMMTVSQALAIMKSSGAAVLIVDKRSEHDEYGIVLLSDIAREVLAVDRAPERVNVYEIMSKPVVGVNPDMDIRYCARLFNKLGFSYAPVIDQGRLLGIVGYSEMLLKGID
ncbi:MAG: CBS domain-containing protein [Gammaproteobacteria bacterium]|nr:CBS domain-containing protein [Gammaproteobacteria bacterium]